MKSSLQRVLRALMLTLAFVSVSPCFAQVPPGTTPTPTPFQVAPGNTIFNITAGLIQSALTFDGHLVYAQVFADMRDQNIVLADPTARAKWVAEWEHKHDSDGALDTEEGTDKACLELINSLDQRYNFYLSGDEWKHEQEAEQSHYFGVGMPLKIKGVEAIYRALPKNPTPEQVKAANQTATTISAEHPAIVADDPYVGSPSANAGVQDGDVITAVDGKPALGQKLEDIVKEIRGPENTTVQVTVTRTDTKKQQSTLSFTLTRSKITIHAVHFVDEGQEISYVKVDAFESQYLEDDWADALTKAAKGKALIVDLRGNPGGNLFYVEDMVSTLLKEGTVIEIHKRDGDELKTDRLMLQPEFSFQTHSSSNNNQLNVGQPEQRMELLIPADMPIVVLTDENSYSASEILSEALKANHRAEIVGETTGGKGVGQIVDQLDFQRDVHVTNFEFLPGGVAMDWIGIIPNHEVKEGDDDLITHGDPNNDTQLRAAIKDAQSLVDEKSQLEAAKKAAKDKHEDEFKKRNLIPQN